MQTYKKENSWREHQASYIQRQKKKALVSLIFKRFLPLVLAGVLVVTAWQVLDIGKRLAVLGSLFSKSVEKTFSKKSPGITAKVPAILSKSEVKPLIADIRFLNARKNIFFVDTPLESFRIKSSLDPGLMNYLISVQENLKKKDRGKPVQIAMVVMDAATGRLLAMAGYDMASPGANPCTRSDFPAASIFKIVTAASAVDALGYTPHTPVFFNGNKYTLYKDQLKETRNQYTVKISLAKAFAGSINPVFGKLGKTLGREKLSAYAHHFGFNSSPASDLSFEPGRFVMEGSDYHVAELGCGFNHDTRISPVFGAMLVATMLNAGRTPVPAIVDWITDSDGRLVFRYKPETLRTAVTPQSADAMLRIMGKTVSAGTAKKSFRGYKRDSVLSTLILGGKTGSLYNRERTIKYDWFAGFGKEKKGDRAIVVSVMVGHGKYIGTRAARHARAILKQYFKAKTLPKSG